jgi:hypothetical protein
MIACSPAKTFFCQISKTDSEFDSHPEFNIERKSKKFRTEITY